MCRFYAHSSLFANISARYLIDKKSLHGMPYFYELIIYLCTSTYEKLNYYYYWINETHSFTLDFPKTQILKGGIRSRLHPVIELRLWKWHLYCICVGICVGATLLMLISAQKLYNVPYIHFHKRIFNRRVVALTKYWVLIASAPFYIFTLVTCCPICRRIKS